MFNEEEILKELKRLRDEVETLKKEIRGLKEKESPLSLSDFYEEIVKKEKIKRKEKVDQEEIEVSIGAKWVPRLGMIALVFGIGFFLKYAFEHYWIGPTGRVIFGLIGGTLLLFIGEFFQSKKYHTYARIFTGGGLLILYLSLWAAHKVYFLIDSILAFFLMCFLTVVSAFFSLRHNSLVVAFFTLIGGFITPFLIGPGDSPRISDLTFLFSYLAILDLGILSLAFFKKWKVLNLAGFLATALVYSLIKLDSFYYPLSLSFFFLSLYFLIFILVSIIYNILRREFTFREDAYLIVLNTIFYYGFSYYLLKPDYHHLLGLFTFGLSLFYLLLADLSFIFNPKDKYLVLIFLGISAVFLATGIFQQLKFYWVTVFWTLEALSLVWVGTKIKEYPHHAFATRMLGLFFLFPSLIRLLVVDAKIPLAEFVPIFNQRVLVFLIYIFVLGLIMKLYSDHRKEISEIEKEVIPAFTLLINFLFVYLISREVLDYFEGKIEKLPKSERFEITENLEIQKNMWLSILWALYSFIIITIGILKKYKLLRWIALALFGITILKLFFLDLSFLKGFPRILSFVILGFLLLAVGFFYNKYKDKIEEFV